jgi:replication factor C subunit 2/4
MNKIPWIEKFRPKNLSEFEQNTTLKEFFSRIVEEQQIPHLLLYGPPGTGKTSAILAVGREIYKEHYQDRVIEFNASNERGINAVRTKITEEARKTVCVTKCSDGTTIPGYKIIILDEADAMTSDAQDALRIIIEKYSSVTRFVFICNYITQITDAIKSRCVPIFFKPLEPKILMKQLNMISQAESMVIDDDVKRAIIDISKGDMRHAVMILQNLNFHYLYLKSLSTPISKKSLIELKNLAPLCIETKKDLTIDDIYLISGKLTPTLADKLCTDLSNCKNVPELSKMSKHIIGLGYPMDQVIVQICQSLLTGDIPPHKKARILLKSGDALMKIKNCASDHIQFLYFCTSFLD